MNQIPLLENGKWRMVDDPLPYDDFNGDVMKAMEDDAAAHLYAQLPNCRNCHCA
jgi:hypothetical protein